jgi:4-carboxymuconolactone decarboxylase
MARVTLVAPEAATPEQQAAFAEVARQRGSVGNLFRAMAHSPEATRRLGALGAFLRFEAALPPLLREAVILAVAGRWGCAYEQHQHVSIATELGLDEATVAALAEGRTGDLPPLEAIAVRYAVALSRDGRADAATAERLRAALGERGLVELTVLVGYYSMLALFLNGLEVEVEVDPPSPPG